MVNRFHCSLYSFSLTAHQARTFLRVCVSHQRSQTGAFTCRRFTPGIVGISNTTARHRRTFSAQMLEALAQAAFLGRGERSEVNLMTCMVTSAGPSPQDPSMPPAFGHLQTWEMAGMGPVLSKSAVPTQKHLPLCPLSQFHLQTPSPWMQPWRRSTVAAHGQKW